MVTPTLLVAGSVSILTGASFALVAHAIRSREVTDSGRPAREAHMVWWLALGAYLVVQGSLTASAGLDLLDPAAYFLSRVLTVPLLCASAWGITYYLVYLYSGSSRARGPLALLYALVGVGIFAALLVSPGELRVQRWIVGVDDSTPFHRVLYLLVGLPPIGASLAYLGLLRRTRDAERRCRIVLVAGSILAYVGAGLAARLFASDAVIFATLVPFGLLAAALSLAAYHPPPALRRRLRAGRTP